MTSEYEHTLKAASLWQECCDFPPDAASLRKFFKQVVLAHWEDPENHGRYKEYLGCYTPVNSEGKGNMDVLMANQDKSGNNVPDTRIVVEMAPTKFIKHAINNDIGLGPDMSTKTSGWQVNTALSIKHVFNDADVALMAAQSTMEFFAGFRQEMCDSLGLNLMEPATIGNPTPVPETKHPQQYFQVEVTITMNYNFCINVNIESHRLKVISFEYTITS